MVYIILVNWNGWKDTIECLESVLRLRCTGFRVLVCDNASEDGSLDRIAEWADGGRVATCANPELNHLTAPPVPKPIAFLRTSSREAISLADKQEKLVLIQVGANLGYAGANNVGLRFALEAGDFEYAWLLNNDTVVDPEALSALLERMRQCPDAGICGSTVLYYDRPSIIQALGGSIYNSWTGRGGHIGLGKNWAPHTRFELIENHIKYVLGASMFVRRQFIEKIGLMNEAYFLYYEEIDWAVRARGKFSFRYAPLSIVYHKEGSSIGTAVDRSRRSLLSDYYAARSCMLFAKRYYPLACPTVAMALAARGLFRLVMGNFVCARAVIRGLQDALRGK